MSKQFSRPLSVKSSIEPPPKHVSLTLRKQRLLALEAAEVGTWRWDITTNEISWDSRCKALFGLPDSVPNVSYEDFFSHLHPDDRNSTKDALQRVLEGKTDYDIIHRAIWPNGSVRWLRCKGRILDRLPPQVTGLAIDVLWAKEVDEKHSQIEDVLRIKSEELEQRVHERTLELERQNAQAVVQARLLDLANDAVLVRGADNRISYWNEGAERLYGWTKNEALGQPPHDLLRTEFPLPIAEVLSSDHWEGELRQTKRDGTQVTVASRWTTLRDDGGCPTAYLEINANISLRKKAEERAKHLTARILALQDEERRKLARELHDSLGQYLASLKINLDLMSIMGTDLPGGRTMAECLSECVEQVQSCLTETRTLSHLMHPPLLDEAGLASALIWYVEGFVKRSGIKAHLVIPPEVPRLRNDVALTLFRSVQEAVTNAHRHSSCSALEVTLAVDADSVRLRVKDNGRGIPESTLSKIRQSNAEVGIGLAGMRERVSELGGNLVLSSDTSGTVVTVVIPTLIAGSEDVERMAG
jgi:PAS domain S-box-containing protein